MKTKVFVTVSREKRWLFCPLRFSTIWNPSSYVVKTFLHGGWMPDIILEGDCEEDVYGGRILKNAIVLEGADHPMVEAVKKHLEGK